MTRYERLHPWRWVVPIAAVAGFLALPAVFRGMAWVLNWLYPTLNEEVLTVMCGSVVVVLLFVVIGGPLVYFITLDEARVEHVGRSSKCRE